MQPRVDCEKVWPLRLGGSEGAYARPFVYQETMKNVFDLVPEQRANATTLRDNTRCSEVANLPFFYLE